MTTGIADKVIVITGASSGLGEATARHVSTHGAKLVLGARRIDRLRDDPDTAARIRQYYNEAAIPADSFARAVAFAISQPEDVDVNEILFRPTRQEL
jgi:NADP-dependent 3-hydroxy acid dehydrogenase YdfG